MAHISLRAYNREISSLIDNGQADVAIAHCQYILQSYPKYIETYRLLGKAYLEGQQHKEAVDVFQRVLTVAPDDFITHIGMSIIREDEGNLDAAIWHMERAFEVQPSNQAIQDELKQLYGKRDGVEPQKIRLTRGALCRMYARGNQYRQAVAEIRSLLAETPDRADLEIVLARMYYNLDMKVEATELCGRLLTKYPHCLEANRIMYKILEDSGKTTESDPYKQRIISLDPYESQVTEEYPSSEQVPEDLVSIEELVYDPNQKPQSLEPEQPVLEETESAPDWMISDLTGEGEELGEKGFTRILDSTNLPREEQESKTDSVSQQAAESESSMGAGQVPEETPSEPALNIDSLLSPTTTQQVEMEAIEDQLPDWLKDTDSSKESTEVAIPDWLKASGWAAAGSITDDAPPTSVIHFESEAEAEIPDVPIVPAEIPDWVQGLAPTFEDNELSQEKSIEPGTEIPEDVSIKLDDWLSGEEPAQADSRPAGTASLHLPDEEGQVEAVTPDWLKGLDEQVKAPAGPSTVFASDTTPSNQPLSTTPGMIYPQPPQTDKLDMEDAFPASGGTSILSPDDVPDWLQDLAVTPENTVSAPSEGTPEAEPSPVTFLAPDLEEPAEPLPSLDHPIQEVVTTTLSPEDSYPDWLPEITKDSPSQTTATLHEESEDAASDMPSWLNILDQADNEEEPLKEPSGNLEEMSSTQNIEEGVSEVVGRGSEKPTTSILPPNPEDQAEDLPEWLKELDGYPEGTSPIADSAQSTSEDFPDWLKGFSESETVEQAPITPASLEVPIEENDDVPNWLSDLDMKGSTVESSAVDVPDWLRGLGPEPETEVAEEPTIQEPTGQGLSFQEPAIQDAQPAEDIPDWIKSLQAVEPVADEETAGETPLEIKFEEPLEESKVEPVTDMEVPEFPISETLEVTEEPVISEVVESVETPESVEPLAENVPVDTPIPAMEFEPPVIEETPTSEVEQEEMIEPIQPEAVVEELAAGVIETPVAEEVLPTLSLEEVEPPVENALPGEVEESTLPTDEEMEQVTLEQPVSQVEEAAEVAEASLQAEPAESEVVTPEYDDIYDQALKSMDTGDLETAGEQFLRLIKAETLLDKVVEKLSSAVETYPTDSGLWMTLGDAFGRSGKLQNALDAYTKAEEYLQ